MIKTPKPRGHFWTHASSFQQTKEFRNIHYDECTTSTSKVLVLGSDDRLTESERVAKRRRIEKLANDFLNGEPLFISSARPCPESLKSTIGWNKKSSNEPKFALPVVDRSTESTALWEDVEDDEEILRQCCSHPKRTKSKATVSDLHPGDEDSVEVQARASCGPAKNVKTSRVLAGPSEDALRQAAELRARRAQRAASELPTITSRLSNVRRALRTNEEPRSEANMSNGGGSSHRKTSRWLLRRRSQAITADSEIDEDSADELRLSGVETPSMPARTPRRLPLSRNQAEPSPKPRAIGMDSTGRATRLRNPTLNHAAPESVELDSMRESHVDPDPDTIVVKGQAEDSPAVGETNRAIDNASDRAATSRSSEQNTYHTAPEETEIRNDGLRQFEDGQSPDDSQTRLLRLHGLRGTSRRSWTSVNEDASIMAAEPSPREATTTEKADVSRSRSRRSSPGSAQLNADSSNKGKRDISLTAKTSRQPTKTKSRTQSAVESLPNAAGPRPIVDQQLRTRASRLRATYTNEQASQNSPTPFQWRRRGSESLTSDARPDSPASMKQRRKVTFPSSDELQPGAKQPQTDEAPQMDSNSPVLDVPIHHDSSFAPKLNMALANEQLDPALRVEKAPNEQVSSANEGALRHSAAGNIRGASHSPSSPQTEAEPPLSHETASQPERSENASNAQDRTAPSQLWPGTQAMLDRAQNDLFTSPEKSARNDQNNATPGGVEKAATQHLSTSNREPWKTLSQEPMPSTQVLLGNFEGFSTVKKPRSGFQNSPLPTPSATGKEKGRFEKTASVSYPCSMPAESALPATRNTRHSSGLRLSTSSTDSPIHSGQIDKPASHPIADFSTTSVATPTPFLKLSSYQNCTARGSTGEGRACSHDSNGREDEGEPSQSFASAAPLPSFQDAQLRSSLPRDDSDLGRTVAELTELLTTKDMDGVLSQVG